MAGNVEKLIKDKLELLNRLMVTYESIIRLQKSKIAELEMKIHTLESHE